ncbi:glycosyltransferase [Endozoicomonas sp. SM1973]|uniref:Glycosyltransferase n=1 Tax=Spartinivicinus marinus TaxID=2994442 RepID=A0A853IAF2_9GAMM|nr:glycosyltransferase family 2 protein [Spartinivicinus marinus]MCX4028813.1 glycosyltransferase family 2 protein [Spartinivicinus marinus]NYZ67628.1 glycosyltransferase [Spartinivicinus marinus]
MKLSIVATLYNSESYIAEFLLRASNAAKQLVGNDFEIILVNDGSPDKSLELSREFTKNNENLVIVDLSRNFGHHKAMMTGLAYAKGDKVFLIDSDLEEEPEWLLLFSKQMSLKNCDVVCGIQEHRKGDLFERWSGIIFYSTFRWLSGLDLPKNLVVARLMSRRYVNALLTHMESELFMAGLWVITGFDQQPYKVVKHNCSETTYSFYKKISQFINSVTAFSKRPLLGIFIIGCFIFMISALWAGYLIVNWLFWERPPNGYTSLMASIWLLGGMVTAFLGIIGIYLSKVYSETKQRPYTIIRNIYKSADFREG